jgi:hypothetical protein
VVDIDGGYGLVAFCAAINHFEWFVLGLIVLRATKNGENDI